MTDSRWSASTSARPASRRSRSRPTARSSPRRRRSYGLSTPQPGWSEQDPEDWWRASEAALARLGVEPARVGLSGQMHGLVCLDEQRPGPPSGDPLERPAHGGGVRGDRGARRARAPHRAHRQPRADGLHGAEAPLAPPPRAGRLRAHPPDRAAEGLRPPPADRRVGDRRGGRLRHAPVRRRTSALERRGSRRARHPGRVASAGQRVDRDRRGGRPAGGRARRGRRSSRARSRSSSAPRASSSPRCPKYAHDPQARVHAFCHAVPDTWEAMGVMLNAAGSLRWFRDALAPGTSFDELTAEAARWERRSRRRDSSCRTSRASARRTPTRTRAASSPASRSATIAARSCAPCSRASPTACATRSSSCASSASRRRAGRASGGGARSRLWLEIVASVLDLPLERSVVDEGSAYGAALLAGVAGGTFASARGGGRGVCSSARDGRAEPCWARRYGEGYARFRALYPAIRGVEERQSWG